MTLGGGSVAISPAFSPGQTAYTATTVDGPTLLVSIIADDPNPSSITIGGVPAAGGAAAVPLAPGVNVITVVVIAQDGVTTETYTMTVTRTLTLVPAEETTGGAPPPSASTPPPRPVPGGIIVRVANAETTPLSPTAPTSVTSAGPKGSAGVVVPTGALPPASVITVGAVSDRVSLALQAPPPRTAQVLLAYAVTATYAGAPVRGGLFEPFAVTMTVNSVPVGSSTDNVFIAYWDGTEWTEIATTATANPDCTYQLSGTGDRMAVYSVMYAPVRQQYDRPRPLVNVNPAVWLGGSLERALALTNATTSIWVFKYGKPFGYRIGGDASANEAFKRLFPQDVISMGTIVFVVRADGTTTQVSSVRELVLALGLPGEPAPLAASPDPLEPVIEHLATADGSLTSAVDDLAQVDASLTAAPDALTVGDLTDRPRRRPVSTRPPCSDVMR